VTCMKRFWKQIFARGIQWFLALLSIALVLTACNPGEQTPVDYVFDDLGRLVAINGTPQRLPLILKFCTPWVWRKEWWE